MPLSTIAYNGLTAPLGGSIITSGTAVASTSGTSIDFTGIPSWVKRITINFNGVINTAVNILVQIGNATPQTTGYLSTGSLVSTSSVSSANYTTGFPINTSNAIYDINGSMIISLLNGNTWSCQGICSSSNVVATWFSSGSTTISAGALQRVRITTLGGTGTFSAGSINILYEG